MQFAYGRVSMYGRIASAQSWSTGWSFAQQGVPTAADLRDYLVNQVSEAVQAAWAGAGQVGGVGRLNSPDTTLDGVRIYYYAAGTNTATVQAEFTYPAPLPGTGGNALPTQTALVASLRTGLPGRSNRGRMYLPCTGAGLTTSHQVGANDVSGPATSLAIMLSNFNAMVNAHGATRVAIASKNGLVPVTQVLVDSETDVQRRRADKIRAAFSSTGTVTGA